MTTSTWVLIIFLSLGYKSGAALDHVKGFETEDGCEIAAEAVKGRTVWAKCVQLK